MTRKKDDAGGSVGESLVSELRFRGPLGGVRLSRPRVGGIAEL